MLGAVGLVLLLVCVNIANLVLVRGSERSREFAVRSALGGSSARLVRQLLIESLTLAVGGAIAGLIVARLAMSAIVALGQGTIPRLASLSLDPRLLLVSLGARHRLCPALRTRCLRSAPRASSRATDFATRVARRRAVAGRCDSGNGSWCRRWPVTFVLLVGAGLLLASFRRIRQVDLGVNRPMC